MSVVTEVTVVWTCDGCTDIRTIPTGLGAEDIFYGCDSYLADAAREVAADEGWVADPQTGEARCARCRQRSSTDQRT